MKSTVRRISLAEAIPEDHYVLGEFQAWHNDIEVTVTAVLERTAVVKVNRWEKVLIKKSLLFVDETFTLARVDPAKAAMRVRAANGWRTNRRRRSGME